MTTKTKKPAAKRAKKAPVVVVNPIVPGCLVVLAKPEPGEANPSMTVTMLAAEYDGPKEIPVAECSWSDPVAGIAAKQRFRLSELAFVCTAQEKRAAVRQYVEAQQENHARRLAEINAALPVAADPSTKAAQAAAQEQKGAV